MTRVAVVTGGTRGIGHAISIALKHKGCRVAANYGGNDVAARLFQAETDMVVYLFLDSSASMGFGAGVCAYAFLPAFNLLASNVCVPWTLKFAPGGTR